MRICISAGHGLRDPGAVNNKLRLKEHLHAYAIAWELRDSLEALGHKVEFISCFQTLGEKIQNVNTLHRQVPFDLAVEIHFNSAASPQANGTEVLYYSTKNQSRAAMISAALATALDTRDRGAVKRDNLGWLKRTDPPALIVETLFIQNEQEARIMHSPGFHFIAADAIARSIS
jgi:N-acetylmuramoyl-L-alanine amidase